MTYSDADLLAYLAGTAAEEMSAGIEAALALDPALEDRLMTLDPLASTIGDALDGLGADRVTLPAQKQSRRIWPLAVAACAGAAIVATVVLWPAPQTTRPWMDQVAAYQALYSPATIANVTPTQEGLAAQFAQLDTALGTQLPLDALQTATTLELRRAQILAFENAPLGQIVFADDTGRPVALCLIRTDSPGRDTATFELHGLNGAAFTQGGFDYLVIGATTRQEAEALANQFSRALAAS